MGARLRILLGGSRDDNMSIETCKESDDNHEILGYSGRTGLKFHERITNDGEALNREHFILDDWQS